MPKATDKSFTEKLHSLWDRKTPKYKRSLLKQGFMLTHYAAEVEYFTEGWLEKNKDPLNENITRLLAASHDSHIALLFSEYAEDASEMGNITKSGVKKRVISDRCSEAQGTANKLDGPTPFNPPPLRPMYHPKSSEKTKEIERAVSARPAQM